jgi:cytochrome P450
VILRLSDTVSAGGQDAERAISGFRTASAEMRTYLADLLEERRAAPRDDLLSRLVAGRSRRREALARRDPRVLPAAARGRQRDTTNLISNAMLCFADHPGELARGA